MPPQSHFYTYIFPNMFTLVSHTVSECACCSLCGKFTPPSVHPDVADVAQFLSFTLLEKGAHLGVTKAL